MGWLLARRFVSGIDRVCRAADVIAAGDYSLRVHSAGEGSEIDHLIRTFNRMVGNTETLMNEQRNISDNIAHDLRTPLTRILGRAELAASGRQELEIYQNTVADIGCWKSPGRNPAQSKLPAAVSISAPCCGVPQSCFRCRPNRNIRN